MNPWLIATAILSIVVLAYVLGGRAWLRRKPWTARFFDRVEPVEILLFRKSESILWARFLQALGLITTALAMLGQYDLSPVYALLPPQYHWIPLVMPLIISVAGSIQECLRRQVTKPLELVELPQSVAPRVAVAVAEAEAAKVNAVEVAKAEAA